MKITQSHYLTLKTNIEATMKAYPHIADTYSRGKFSRSDKTRDLQRRFCFDLAYGSGLSNFICNTLYEYLDDTHIYTALRRICPTVHKEY